ncbi:DNA polymerase Y family protein [Ramlibacter sp.]|uniref:DNA polymerase Y family protein n=1 Tax=Ramlibacter sp. TaxID=1917967 RepID=UPI003D09E548
MYWIALLPSHDEERTAWGWRALQFSPRVAAVEEALLVEASGSVRLWGGRQRLLRRLLKPQEGWAQPLWADGPTSLVALALLRMKRRGDARPAPDRIPDDLALEDLSAARASLATLERIGCNRWGELRALPRGGVSRRFGAGLLAALGCAYGEQPETYPWLELPERFDVNVELPALATSAPELMWTAQRLMSQMHVWLQSRNRGVVTFEFEWTLDLKRLDGKVLPPTEKIEIGTAQPTQDMAHLRRLVGEHLDRTRIAAPANRLRLRSLETVPWGGITTSLLPEDNRKGEKLHQLVERLSVRLGEDNVRVPALVEDHRPEKMQAWVCARGVRVPASTTSPDAIYPTWLLPQPLQLDVQGNTPQYGGPLRRLARLYRVETAWWEEGGAALRDYFIARGESCGLVWIFRERLESTGQARWYLQGLYA